MAVTLINIARPPRMLTYNLDHVQHRKTLKFLKASLGKRGETVLRREGKEIGDSITLAAKGTKGSSRGGLPDTILECSEIKAAIAKREIRAERELKAAATPKPSKPKRSAKPKAPPAPSDEAKADKE